MLKGNWNFTVLSHSVVSDSLRSHRLYRVRLLCPWGFSRQEYSSGLPCPSPGDLPNPGTEHRSLASQSHSLPSERPDWLWDKKAMCVFSDLIIVNYKDFACHVLQAKAAFPTLDLVHNSCISVSEEGCRRVWGSQAVRFFTFSMALSDSIPGAFHSCSLPAPNPLPTSPDSGSFS